MLRNREFRWLLVSMLASIGICEMITMWLLPEASLLVLLVSVLLSVAFVIFTLWRYRELEKLSVFLRRISNGDYSLDVRDNYEGELSLLKNEIYKVTSRLAEQSAHLQTEKVRLTDAISDISHQLKTPLTSMTVMADLLGQDDLPATKRKEFTHHISMQLERIDWLLSSLLKLSKLDAGTVVFKQERIWVHELIQQALEPLRIPIELKQQQVELEGDDDVSFIGDMNWTAEALINILKNAVEHTPEHGHIRIAFATNPLYTEIVVTDDGTGIDKSDLPYIFKRFYKGKHAGEGSVGIGLAMAHSIVTAQQGDIEVESEQGAGTQFRLRFFKKSNL